MKKHPSTNQKSSENPSKSIQIHERLSKPMENQWLLKRSRGGRKMVSKWLKNLGVYVTDSHHQLANRHLNQWGGEKRMVNMVNMALVTCF